MLSLRLTLELRRILATRHVPHPAHPFARHERKRY